MVPIWQNPVALFYPAMYMKKGSQFTQFIAHELKKMKEVGIKNVLSRRHITPQPNCEPLQKKGKSLGMEKFASLFALYSVGILISLIVLTIEAIVKFSKSVSPFIQKDEEILRLKTFQIELQNLVAKNGMKLSGDVRSGWIIEK
jgi:hypothetical protein